MVHILVASSLHHAVKRVHVQKETLDNDNNKSWTFFQPQYKEMVEKRTESYVQGPIHHRDRNCCVA